MVRIVSYVILISVIGIFVISNHHAEAVGNPVALQNELNQLCKINPNAPFCANLQAPSSFNSQSSTIHTFEKTGFTLTHTPMICTLEPAPVQLIRDLGMNLRSMTEGAISNWEYDLNGFQDPNWKVVLNEVSYDKIATFDSSKCDITISYLPSPTSSPDAQEPVGVTTYDSANHKAQIVIYYLKMTWDLKTTETRDSNYIYYHYTPTFSYVTNQLATEQQIDTTLRHELGHAFGLGHYVISEQEQNDLIDGKGGNVPSIMVPIVIPQTGNYYSITSADVQQLKSLYGANGFNSATQTQPPSPPVVPSQSPQSIPVPTNSIFSNVTNPQSNTYRNDTDQFSFTPPSGWTKIPTTWSKADKNGNSISEVVAFSKFNGDNQIASYGVFYRSGSAISDQTLAQSDDQLLTLIVNAYTASTENVIEKSIKRFSDGLKFHLVSTSPSGFKSEKDIFTLKDGRFYILMMKSGQNDYDYSADFQSVVDTFYASQNTLEQQPVLTKPIPSWIKNNAYYWSIGNIGDDDFVKGIQYMIQQKVITIPPITQGNNSQNAIPNWIKKDAKLWAQGDLTDDDFTKAIQFLITGGIIRS